MWYLYLSDIPDSHLLTVLSLTLKSAANADCVSPLSRRRHAMILPVVTGLILLPPYVLYYNFTAFGDKNKPTFRIILRWKRA